MSLNTKVVIVKMTYCANKLNRMVKIILDLKSQPPHIEHPVQVVCPIRFVEVHFKPKLGHSKHIEQRGNAAGEKVFDDPGEEARDLERKRMGVF